MQRAAAAGLQAALRAFRVVALVGARQVGKTTLARSGAAGPRGFVSLDDLGVLAAARGDPQGFVKGLRTPVTIDEFQRAPGLLLAIKQRVDEEDARGRSC